MNKFEEGTFRKTEFECIDDIDIFALELNKELEEVYKKEREYE